MIFIFNFFKIFHKSFIVHQHILSQEELRVTRQINHQVSFQNSKIIEGADKTGFFSTKCV